MDNKILTKYISAFSMAGGGLYVYPKLRNAYYQTKKSEANKDYIDWQSDILSQITRMHTTYTPAQEPDAQGRSIGGYYVLKSMQHPKYTTVRERMYVEGRRVLSLHDLKLMDEETLAVLFMDSGRLQVMQKKTHTHPIAYIAARGYTYAENDLLRRFIKDRFNVHFNVCKQKARSGGYHHLLKCAKFQTAALIRTIKPYILESFRYKIELPDEWLLSDSTSDDNNDYVSNGGDEDDEIVETTQECAELDRNDLVTDE